MDPKSMPNLDPKLRETYERVMGTTLKPSTTDKPKAASPTPAPSAADLHAPAPMVPPTSPSSEPGSMPPLHSAGNAVSAASIAKMEIPQPTHESNSDKASPPIHPHPDMHNTGTGTVRLDATNDAAANHPEGAKDMQKKKGKISPVIFIVGGVVFFLVYALFWAKVLNLPLPF